MIERIRVMISSRCNDDFPPGSGRRLSDIRRRIKADIEAERVFGEQLFEVWINEDEPPGDLGRDAVEHCLQQARRADLLIALYNGHAGWVEEGGVMGICHRELKVAHDGAPAKVYAIELLPLSTTAVGPVHDEFRQYTKRLNAFRGNLVTSEDDLINKVRVTLAQATSNLLQAGTRDTRHGGFYLGEALDWSKLSMRDRKGAMEDEFKRVVLEKPGCRRVDDQIAVEIGERTVLLVAHGIPGAMTLAPAREMVGQPYLRDHQWAPLIEREELEGPVHILLCQKGATETQAMKLLGYPDATFVETPFGVYVADSVHKIQLILLTNSRDPSGVRNKVQAFFEWLYRSGEQDAFATRAEGRRKVVELLATLQSEADTPLGQLADEMLELPDAPTENGLVPLPSDLN